MAKVLTDTFPVMGSSHETLRVPTAGIGASAQSGERLCLVRQTGVKQVAREAEQTPIEFSQSHITLNGSGSSPLHHSPVNEIS